MNFDGCDFFIGKFTYLIIEIPVLHKSCCHSYINIMIILLVWSQSYKGYKGYKLYSYIRYKVLEPLIFKNDFYRQRRLIFDYI